MAPWDSEETFQTEFAPSSASTIGFAPAGPVIVNQQSSWPPATWSQLEEWTAQTFKAHPLRHIRERHCFGDHPERIAVCCLMPISRGCPQFEKEISVPDTVRCINSRQVADKRSRNAFRSGHRIDDMRFDRFHATPNAATGS